MIGDVGNAEVRGDLLGAHIARRGNDSVDTSGLEARVALEIESVPTILDPVQPDGFHAVLTLNAVRRSGNEQQLMARPIGKPRLSTTLRLATSVQRPAGRLMEQAIALVRDLVSQHWA